MNRFALTQEHFAKGLCVFNLYTVRPGLARLRIAVSPVLEIDLDESDAEALGTRILECVAEVRARRARLAEEGIHV